LFKLQEPAMDLSPMHKRVIALDVHQAKITACAMVGHENGHVEVIQQDFGAFKRDRRALAQWALQIRPEVVVMESTGVYWKSPFAALEAVGIVAWVVNARHVKAVPGRKTDMADAHWLAMLARAGLLRASFVPPLQFRQLRLVARQRQKLVGMCSAEKNRLYKVLVDAGIRINVLVADIHGSSARAMLKALIAGQPMHEVLDRKGRIRASREDLCEALSTEQLSAVHRFVAEEDPAARRANRTAHRQARPVPARWLASLAASTEPAADHPWHRPAGRGDVAGGNWCRHGRVRQCRALGLLGGRLSGQQRERRQAQERANPAWQCLGSPAAVRVRASRCQNAMCTEGQVRFVGHPQRAQEVHRCVGAQNAAHDLRHAGQRFPLPRQERRLRSAERRQKRPALDQDAAKTRLHASARSRLINT
jgi:hypothetical protein